MLLWFAAALSHGATHTPASPQPVFAAQVLTTWFVAQSSTWCRSLEHVTQPLGPVASPASVPVKTPDGPESSAAASPGAPGIPASLASSSPGNPCAELLPQAQTPARTKGSGPIQARRLIEVPFTRILIRSIPAGARHAHPGSDAASGSWRLHVSNASSARPPSSSRGFQRHRETTNAKNGPARG